MGLREQDVTLEVKWYFDLAKVMNNLWRINLLIMVILDGHKYVYSEGSAYDTLIQKRESCGEGPLLEGYFG